MCGIVALVGSQPAAAPQLLEGLRQLEYRGYDSAGLATVDQRGAAHLPAGQGQARQPQSAGGGSGGPRAVRHRPHPLGHPWQTRGAQCPSPPQCRWIGVAVVQNGIIENHRQLRDGLEASGVEFQSETDTEVIPIWCPLNSTDAFRSVNSPAVPPCFRPCRPCCLSCRVPMPLR